MPAPSFNWTCAGVCLEQMYGGANHSVCCVGTYLSPSLLSNPWSPWVSALVGVLLGVVATLALVWLSTAALQLLLSGCDPRRAWPTSPCWRSTSPTRRLGEDVEDGGSVGTLDAPNNQQDHCLQQLRGLCCTCCGHRG